MGETSALLIEVFLETLTFWWVIIPTIFLGLIVGGIPEFSAANTIIILMPLTLAMTLQTGLVFMVTLYCSSRMGAGIPAILVNIPGTAGAAATPLDGYPMAKQGKGQQALAISFVSSTIGGFLTTIVALATMPILARVGFYMHSVEMIVVMLFGISLIASIASQDMLKGLIAGFLGLMLGSIGTDVVYATPRATFGFLELYDGVPLIPALVGLFAVSEVFIIIEKKVVVSRDDDVARGNWTDTFDGVRMALSLWWHIIWTSIIGPIIGVIPGADASIASFVAYQQSRNFSKTPELYGTGHPEGLIAPESANNGVTSGTLVPLLVLGIPGGATAAIMLVVMQFHGVSFGPSLFESQPKVGYEQVKWNRGAIQSRDWESYPVIRFDNIPQINVTILDRPAEKSLGAGEATPGSTLAAIGNAIFDATGIRMRRMPFTPEAIRQSAYDE